MNTVIKELKCQNCFAPLNVKGQTSGIIRCEYCGTDNAMPSDVRQIQAEDSQTFVVALMKALVTQVSLGDIRNVCVLLEGRMKFRVDYEDLGGEGKADKARELVLFCRRRAILQGLVDAILEVNPRFELVI